MAFSIRSFFGKEKGPDPLAAGMPPQQGSALPPLGANPFQSAFNNPFAANVTHQAGDPASAPMNSPFTPFTPADSGRTDLTVGDILPGLPLEALNNRQVPLNQPLHLADEIVERALSSGQAAIPLFEIYRVCPALFPAAISPEDQRTVPIPPHKIAGLIPKSGPAGVPGAGASPFAIAPPGSAPGFAGGGPTNKSVFSPFVQAEGPAAADTDSSVTLFQPSPFNFGAPTQQPPGAEQPPAASPFGVVGGSPEPGVGAMAPGMPNPFAPTSAASFSSMAFGHAAPAPAPTGVPPQGAPGAGPASPFSFGAPPAPPVASTAPPAHTHAQAPAPEAARPAPSPFDFTNPGKPSPAGPSEASPFAPAGPAPAPPASQQQASPLWSGGSPFAPSPAATPFPAPAESGPFAFAPPPASQPGPATAGASAPQWMPTPAKPGIGASPFAGFAVPPPAQPAPLAPLPPDHGSAPLELQAAEESPAPSPAAASPPAPVEVPREQPPATTPVAGMPAFPGMHPASPEGPAARPEAPVGPFPQPFQPGSGSSVPGPSPEQAFPPLQPGPFSPAPELVRPAQPQPQSPVVGNPFERIQALSRTEAAPAAPVEASARDTASSPAPAPEPPAPAAPASSLPAAPPERATPAPQSTPVVSGPVPGPISSAMFAPAPELRPLPHLQAPTQGAVAEKVSLSLASVLRGCKTHEIGMSPDHIPSWVKVHLPLDLIRPQLLSGKVTLRVTQVMAALDAELRNLITPSRPDLSVDLSMSELRKALPNEPFPEPAANAYANAGAGAGASGSGPAPMASPIFQPFTPAAPQEAAKAQAPDLVFGTPTTPPPVPPFFQAAASEPPAQPLAADGAWPLPPGSQDPDPAPVAESAELATAFSFLKDEPEVESVAPAAAPPSEAVIEAQPVAPAAAPAAAEPPAPVSLPARTPSVPATEPPGITKSAIRVIPPTPANQSASQMLLRALLNTDEPLDTASVAQHLACQPGIVAVVCLRDGTCLASAGNGSAEAEHFLNQAPKLHHHVQPLIQLTGSLDTETFSMNSGALVITFSLQSEITLGVLHDPRTQAPALRERITLIARSIAPLLNLPAA